RKLGNERVSRPALGAEAPRGSGVATPSSPDRCVAIGVAAESVGFRHTGFGQYRGGWIALRYAWHLDHSGTEAAADAGGFRGIRPDRSRRLSGPTGLRHRRGRRGRCTGRERGATDVAVTRDVLPTASRFGAPHVIFDR